MAASVVAPSPGGDDSRRGRAAAAAVAFDQRYELGELLGSGGMGRVYRAWDRTLRRTVAIKMIGRGLAADEAARQRFLREAQAAAALDHPNIAPVYEAGTIPGGEAYIAMACYTGESLKQRLERGRLPSAEAIRIATELAGALACAHRQGVVHRDVKPSNVILTADGQVKLIDFGVARQADLAALTLEGQMLGTPAYMAPESVRGGAYEAGSDLWALGVVVYEMLAGRRPFDGDDAHAVVHAILHVEPPRLALPETAPQAPLMRVLARALAKDPRRRYQTAEELCADLEAVASGSTATAPLLAAARARPRRRWALVAGSFAAAAALAAGFPRLAPQAQPAREPGAVVVLPFANLTGDHDLDYIGQGLAAGLISEFSELPALNVVSRSRTAEAAARDREPAAIGERLGVSTIVEGTVRRIDDRLRIDVSLTDALSSQVVWSRSFLAGLEQVYGLQAEMASTIAPVLEVPVSRNDRHENAGGRPAPRAYDFYLRGLGRLGRPGNPEDAEAAAELLRQALRIQPDIADFHAALADALWQRHLARLGSTDLDAVEREARAALALDPRLPAAHIALARALRARGKAEESIAALEPLLASHPKPDEAFRELAFGYESAGDLPAAEDCFRTAASLAPGNWYNWNALGGFLSEQGELDEARRALDRAVELVPAGIPWPRLNRGGLRTMLADYVGAVADFEATGAATSNSTVASNLATAHYFAGDLERAEAAYRRAVALDPEDPLLLRNLGDTLLKRGRGQEAVASFRAALGLTETRLGESPADEMLLLERALYEAKAGQCDAALGHARELAPRLPDSGANHLDLAMAFALCRASSEALDELAACIRAGVPPAFIAAQDELSSLAADPRFARLTVAGPG